MVKVAVSSRSFSQHAILRKELQNAFSSVKFNETNKQLVGNELINFLQDAEHAIIGLELVDEALLSHLPNLKAICKMGTGIDKVDFNALKKYQVAFEHTPGVNKRSVSELVIGLILTLLRQLAVVNQELKQGEWKQPRGTTLSGKTVGIIGFGAIGRDLASLLNAFDCRCVVYDLQACDNLPSHVSQQDLPSLLKVSDIVTLHIPFNENNYHFLSASELSLMKKTAILINTARGGLIDEMALYEALKNGNLAGAALDVFEQEPHISEELLALDNFFATSHIAGSTDEAILAMGLQAIENLKTLIKTPEEV